MPTIQEARQQFPELAGLDDDQLVGAIHQAEYPDLTRDQVAKALGVTPPAGPDPTLWQRAKQGFSDTLNAADLATTTDPTKIAGKVAAANRDALPQTQAQQQMAEEIKPLVDAYGRAEGSDSVFAFAEIAAKRIAQFARNPKEFAGSVVQNLPNSLPGMAGMMVGGAAGSAGGPVGSAVGAVAGGFGGGFLIERGSELRQQIEEEAQRRGIDTKDEKALLPLITEKLEEFTRNANLKGVGTAGTDTALNMVTLGMAGAGSKQIAKEIRAVQAAAGSGKLSKDAAEAQLAALAKRDAAHNTLGAKTKRGLAVTGAEMAGEGASEAAGQLLAYGKANPLEVIDESLMGLGQGVGMAAGHGIYDKVVGTKGAADGAPEQIQRARDAIAEREGGADLSSIGSEVAKRLGLDAATMLSGAATNPKAGAAVARMVIDAAVRSGVIDKLPADVAEQVLQNIATDRPLAQGINPARVLSAMAASPASPASPVAPKAAPADIQAAPDVDSAIQAFNDSLPTPTVGAGVPIDKATATGTSIASLLQGPALMGDSPNDALLAGGRQAVQTRAADDQANAAVDRMTRDVQDEAQSLKEYHQKTLPYLDAIIEPGDRTGAAGVPLTQAQAKLTLQAIGGKGEMISVSGGYIIRPHAKGKIVRTPGVQGVGRDERALQQSAQQVVPGLRGAGDSRPPGSGDIQRLPEGSGIAPNIAPHNRQDRQREGVRAGERAVGDQGPANAQSKQQQVDRGVWGAPDVERVGAENRNSSPNDLNSPGGRGVPGGGADAQTQVGIQAGGSRQMLDLQGRNTAGGGMGGSPGGVETLAGQPNAQRVEHDESSGNSNRPGQTSSKKVNDAENSNGDGRTGAGAPPTRGGQTSRVAQRGGDDVLDAAAGGATAQGGAGAGPNNAGAGGQGVVQPAQPVAGEWKTFPPESKSLNIPRAEMPQVKAEHRGALTQFMLGRGIAHGEETEVDPATLRPTQAEIGRAHV